MLLPVRFMVLLPCWRISLLVLLLTYSGYLIPVSVQLLGDLRWFCNVVSFRLQRFDGQLGFVYYASVHLFRVRSTFQWRCDHFDDRQLRTKHTIAEKETWRTASNIFLKDTIIKTVTESSRE